MNVDVFQRLLREAAGAGKTDLAVPVGGYWYRGPYHTVSESDTLILVLHSRQFGDGEPIFFDVADIPAVAFFANESGPHPAARKIEP